MVSWIFLNQATPYLAYGEQMMMFFSFFKLQVRVLIRFFPMHLNNCWISLVMFGTYPPVGGGEKYARY